MAIAGLNSTPIDTNSLSKSTGSVNNSNKGADPKEVIADSPTPNFLELNGDLVVQLLHLNQ